MKFTYQRSRLIYMWVFSLVIAFGWHSTYAQQSDVREQLLRFAQKRIHFSEAIQALEQQAGLQVYLSTEVSPIGVLNLPSTQLRVEGLLLLFQDTLDIEYQLEHRLLSLRKKRHSKGDLSFYATGWVSDISGLSLPGATIVNLSTAEAVMTDLEGRFELQASPGDRLSVSFLGFEDRELEASIEMRVQLSERVSNLDEIVVIGYGTVKKKDLTGSVGQVQGELIEQRNTTQLSQSLQGQLSGVTVTRSSNAAGSKASIKVRGVTTIGNSDPLIVVDGVAVDDIDEVNTNDVQDISVLKDAAAASIYGARAAAGVILITTKRARDGEFRFSYKSDFGMEKPTALPEPVGYERYMQMINEMSWNDAGNPENGEHGIFSAEAIAGWRDNNRLNPDLYPITDWQDLLLKKSASKERHSFSMSGGGKHISSRASVDYENVNALYDIENYKRIMTRINNSVHINDFISGDIDFSYNSTKQLSPINNPMWESIRYAPIYAAQWQDGRVAEGKSGSNAYASLYYGGDRRHFSDKAYGRFALNITPMNGLKLSVVLAPQLYFNRRKNFTKKISYFDAEDPTRYSGLIAGHTNTNLTENRNEGKQLTKQILATYTKEYGRHYLNGMLGYEDNYSSVENLGATASHLELDNFPYLDLAPQDYMFNSGNKYETAYRSYFGRLIYSFDDKYHFQGNIRRDGSSRFHKDHRWGVFPSFSVGWTVSNEDFMRNQQLVSHFKLRGSWGTLGNERIGNYPYQSSIDFSNVLLYKGEEVVSSLTAAQVQYAIQNISWETTESIDFGADVYFFNNRLGLTVDYYKKKTRDMLLELEIPSFMGYVNPQQNAGEMYTEGWDLDLSWRNHIGDLKYSISANLSDSRSVMGNLNGRIVMTDTQIIREGTSYNEWYGYVSDGLFQNSESIEQSALLTESVQPGDIKYVDISGPDGMADGKISPDYDRVPLGSSLPRWVYGGHLQVEYKGVELGVAFQGVGKKKSLLSERQIRPFQSSWTSPMKEIDGNYWSPYQTETENAQARYPRLSHVSAENNNYKMSDFWLINGAYFRIKNITLAYNFPSEIIKTLSLDRLRVYLSLNDVFTHSHFPKGFDPEASYNTYLTQSISLGVSVNF